MKKLALSTLISLSLLATAVSTPAQAGKRERKVIAGIAIGAIAGAIIAGEVSRHHRKKKAKRSARREMKNRRMRQQARQERRLREERRYRRDRRNRWQERRDWNDYGFYSDRTFRDYRYDEPGYLLDEEPERGLSSVERHIERCRKAYRTYDPQSDTYLKRDGSEHQCRL